MVFGSVRFMVGLDDLKVQIHLSHFNLSSLIHLLVVFLFFSGSTLGYVGIYMTYFYNQQHLATMAINLDGYKLFRRDRRGRRGGGVALYVRECLDSLELDDRDDRVECLWVRIRGKANKADIVVGVCYRPPNQDEETDELFYKQLGEAS
ncbi:hypothetical protein QYF61_008085 [Mycteria americana]|uniref:Uncharacterized protein n=1 Tax=Mycteria americana TaxID=33587 RepID=A0AAN7S2N8_MYCAM|nr:hypothetical protein QYF61_008085 [Mycteria americana]